MARLPRLTAPGFPHHVIQRGNNRQAIFMDAADYETMLALLAEQSKKFHVAVHAYVLMGNHVHLLLTAPEPGAIGRLMQKLGRRYVRLFNLRHGRTGTLWEGRYKACLVGGESYVLRCARYIDLNPVRARMTTDPVAYRWSSCAVLCGQRDDPMVIPHSAQLALGATADSRARAYRKFIDEAISSDEVADIRVYLQQQRAWGRDSFRAMVEAKTQRFAGVRPAHRPPRERSAEK